MLFCRWFLANFVPQSEKLLLFTQKASISNYRCHENKCFCPENLVWKSFLDTILWSRSLWYVDTTLLNTIVFSRRECRQVTNQECRIVVNKTPVKSCESVPKQKCTPVQKQHCVDFNRQVCQQVPEQVPRQQCQNIPRDVCHTEPRKVCQNVTIPKCVVELIEQCGQTCQDIYWCKVCNI